MTDDRLIKSYVWYGDKCFFVSTIDRDSSSMAGGRFSETIAWEFDWDKNERGAMVGQCGGSLGSIHWHIKMCQSLFDTGQAEEIEE